VTVCWHGDGRGQDGHKCPGQGPDGMLCTYGRCRSGRRWFWAWECYDWRGGQDEIGGHGWAATEDEALQAARSSIESAAAGRHALAYVRQSVAPRVLKSVNAAKRRARPPSGEKNAQPVQYLYEPWSWYDDDGKTHKGISEIPIVKKTPKRIYYDHTSRWDKQDDMVTLGYIDRSEFETDTNCRVPCPVDTLTVSCSEHHIRYPHCVHVHSFTGRWKARYPEHLDTCGAVCPLDVETLECQEHGYTWEHCPHGGRLGDCYHGSAAGRIARPGAHWWDHGGYFFATREAAEEYLYSAERERERQRPEREAEMKRLRREMAAVHPDRGGTNEEFIAARERYEQALRRVS
jgi:hypothetical protein